MYVCYVVLLNVWCVSTGSLCAHELIHIHVSTHAHTHEHTRMYYTHAHVHARTHMYMYTRTRTHTHQLIIKSLLYVHTLKLVHVCIAMENLFWYW